MNRWDDWWQQAKRDAQHARNSLEVGDYEWAAFAAHQAAEKAIKALIMSRGGEPWGHSVMGLLESLPDSVAASLEILEAGSRLDKHYLPARYPNGFPSGYPGKLYTKGEAERAIEDCEQVLELCRGNLPR